MPRLIDVGNKTPRLATPQKFTRRLLRGLMYGLLFIVGSLLIGILGYHYTADLSWLDSFLNASMILSGMGPIDTNFDTDAKLFAGFYSLFSGLAFLTGAAFFVSPIIHRALHRFHISDLLEEEEEEKES